MAAAQIFPVHTSLPLPPSASQPSSVFQQLFPLSAVLFPLLAMFLRFAAVKRTSPTIGDFLGNDFVPWLSARVRLRLDPLHRSAAAPPRSNPLRDPPDPPLRGLEPADCSRFARSPVWLLQFFVWSDPGIALNLQCYPDPRDSVEMGSISQPCQDEQVGSYIRAGQASRPIDQAGRLSRAGYPSQAAHKCQVAEPSRVIHLSRAVQFSHAFISTMGEHSRYLFGECESIDVVYAAQVFEPDTHA